MYYAHFILNKKGPLAKIWLAAHWDKKLTKAQIYETNIESTIETILEPQMKLALRTSGHLLLGVCRIYSRKVKYLLADCNEAFVKIKLAFRPGLIDLPKEKQQASVDAITLPEKFPDFSINFADINMEDMDLSKNLTQQARIEDITLKEDFGTFVTTQDDDFGDMGSFGMDMDTFMISDLEKGRRLGDMNSFGVNGTGDDFFDDNANTNNSIFANELREFSKQNDNDMVQDIDLNELNPNETNGMDSAMANKINEFNAELENPVENNEDTLMHDIQDMGDNDVGINTTGAPAVVPTLFEDQPTVNNINPDEPIQKIPRLEQDTANTTLSGDEVPKTAEDELLNEVDGENKKENENPDTDTATTAPNVDAAPAVVEKQIRTRRRRKLIIDEVKEIDSATMKSQLSDTSGILGSLELAPPTRKLMQWKEMGGVDKLFSMTSRPLYSKTIQKLYSRNMVTKSLADITNSSKLDKSIVASKELTNPAGDKANTTITSFIVNEGLNKELSEIEASMNDNQLSKSMLPLADSIIDNPNDASKQNNQQLDDVTLESLNNDQNKLMANDLDEFDQFGGPASIFNTNANIEDLLDELPQNINLEITPTKLDNEKEKETNDKDKTTIAEESEDDEEEEDEDENNENKKQHNGKNTSPNTSHKQKRQYRRSNVNKDNTVKEDPDETVFDDTMTNDPTKNLNKRAKTMVSLLNKNFNKNDNVGFFEITKRNGRKNVVQKFYSLLVLKKYEIIDVTQAETYGDIIITKGDKFDDFAPN